MHALSTDRSYHTGFEGRVALVTGSTAGLGLEIASQLCEAGAKVVLNGRDREKLEQCVADFRSRGHHVAGIQGNVSKQEDCQRIVGTSVDTFGKLDILVNNAGIGSAGTFLDTLPEIFRKVIEVNTLGSIYMTRFALPHIIRSEGSIIFISSLAALTGVPYSSLYSASKMALTAIGQSLGVELKGTGVHVGVAYIGFLDNGPDKRVLGPDGRLQHTGERSFYKLQPMQDAGKCILKMVARRKRVQVMSTLGRSLYFANRFAPWLVRIVKERSLERARISYEPAPKS